MDGSESIVAMIYIRKDILAVRTYSFITGMSKTKIWNIFWREKLILKLSKNEAQLIENM